ncbi:hypothetical protein K3495_g9464 [Podosphaera aphanis]|uniref:Uncharacterized protein n=1 Tax=Lygus hesperus TaxID=30085 RepID=A0A0A9XDZ6_LYGHE|nr:hypothetical protein K3495_g9464 [Podosphaera aphanis]
MGRAFAVPMRTEHRDQASICPFALREVSVLAELTLGHLRYYLTDVPPQSNSPPGSVLESDHAREIVAGKARQIRETPSSGKHAPEGTTHPPQWRPLLQRPPATLGVWRKKSVKPE